MSEQRVSLPSLTRSFTHKSIGTGGNASRLESFHSQQREFKVQPQTTKNSEPVKKKPPPSSIDQLKTTTGAYLPHIKVKVIRSKRGKI